MGEPMSDQSLSERVEADDTGDPATFNREWWDDITRHWNFPMGLFTQYESWQIAADEWSDGVSYEVRESDPSNPDFPWCEATLSGHLDGTPTALEVIVRALNGVPVLLAEVDRLTADNARLRVISEAAQRWGQAIVVAEAAPVGANSFERIAAHEAADALLVALGIPPHPADRANQAGEEAP